MSVPQPPNEQEKYSYLRTNRLFLYSFGIISTALLVTGMMLFAFHQPVFLFYTIIAFIIGIYLFLGYYIGIGVPDFDFEKHEQLFEKHRIIKHSVDVLLPCCGESLEILNNTYEHVKRMQMHYGYCNVYVLDDKGDIRVKDLADRYDFHYISRPNKGEHKKAGNLRYAFAKTFAPYFLILDADFAPRYDMLNEMMPYFIEDEKVAIVQSPQFFNVKKEMSWIEKGAGQVQELFYRCIQTMRNHYNGSICVGSCAVYKREALEPFGGTYLIGFSEDVWTGWSVITSGWKIQYIPINLAKGVCPDELPAYFNQMYRWSMGSLMMLFSKEYWKSKMTIHQRICYLSGQLFYLSTALGIFVTPLPSLLMVWIYPEKVVWYSIIFSLPSFIFGTIITAIWSKSRWSIYSMRARIVSYYAHLFALKDLIFKNIMVWQPTGTVKKSVKFESAKNLLFVWSIIDFAIILSGVSYNLGHLHIVNFLPTLFFTTLNFVLAISILKDQ